MRMNSKNNISKIITSITLSLVFVFSALFQNVEIKTRAAATTLRWIQDKVLNYQLSEVSSTDNEFMVQFDITNEGVYKLEFFTEDVATYTFLKLEQGIEPNIDTKAVKHVITFNKAPGFADGDYVMQMKYKHNVYVWNNTDNDFTYSVDKLYAPYPEWDFDAQPAPKYESVIIDDMAAYDGVQYTILESFSRRGKIYQLNGQEFKFLWAEGLDVETGEEKEYFKLSIKNLAGYTDGVIYPFKAEVNGSNAGEVNVLQTLRVSRSARRWGVLDKDPFKFTDNKTQIEELKKTDSSLARPGIEFSITRPRKFNKDTGMYEFISNAEAEKLKLTFNFDNGKADEENPAQVSGITLGDLIQKDSTYVFDIIGHEACDKCADKNCPHFVLSEFTNPNTGSKIKYVLSENLKDSRVYSVGIVMEGKDDSSIISGLVKRSLNAYTYIDFDIIRRNIEETYVELVPYNYPGTYEVYVVNADVSASSLFGTDSNKWAAHYVLDTDNIPEKIYIPVSMMRGQENSNWYTIGIKFIESGRDGENSINSEIKLYDSNADKDITVDVPYLNSPTDIIVVNDNEGKTKASSFNISWSFPTGLFDGEGKYRILNKADEKIWYEVLLNTSMKDKYNQKYQVVEIISLTRNNDGTVTLTNRDGTLTQKYTQEETEFNVKITLKDAHKDWAKYFVPNWRGIDDDITRPIMSQMSNIGKYIEGENQHLTYKNDFFNPNTDRVPGNYFITMRAYYDPDLRDEKLTISDFSLPVNVNLKEIKESIPVPREVEILDVTKNDFKIEIEEVNIYDYEKKMLKPIYASVDNGKPKYEVLFTQSEDNIRNLLKTNMMLTDKELNVNDFAKLKIVNYTSDNASDYTTFEIGENDTSINELRSDYVYAFTTSNPNVEFKGLDENQTYYVVVRTVLDIEEELVDETINYTRYSKTSTLFFTRTSTDVVLPDSDEKMPPTPLNFKKDESPTDKQVIVRWEEPNLVDEKGYSYGYELIRVADIDLLVDDRNSKLTVKELYDKEYEAFKAYRIIDDVLYAYNEQTDTWEENTSNDQYQYMENENYMRIIDVGVNPNRLYYYYIRTLKFEETPQGKVDNTNSEWVELSATTMPISGIENLKEVIKYDMYGINNLNEFYEVVISFEAPIADAVTGTINAVLPTTIDFSIQTKLSRDNVYETPKSITLVAISAIDEKNATYVYKISNLESGSKYDVRVAMIDKTSSDANGNFAMSKYSDSISVRTEFSQEDHDRKEQYDAYEEYYDSILDDILNDIVYVIEDTKDRYSVKYKEERLLGEIGRNISSLYHLDTKEGVNNYEYYISKAAIEEMTRTKKGLRIEKDGTIIVLPYRFIDELYTNEYYNVMKKIKDKKDIVSDFYIKLSVDFDEPTEYINTKKTLSDIGSVGLEIIELTDTNTTIDYEIEVDVLAQVESEKEDFFDELYKELNGEINDKLFLEKLEEKKKEIVAKLGDIIENTLSEYEKTKYQIKELYSPMNVKINSYYKDGKILSKTPKTKWVEEKTLSSLDTLTAYIYKLGSFVLAREYDVSVEYADDKTYNASSIKEKYNLDDVFVRSGTLDLENGVVSANTFRNVIFTILTIDNSNVYEQAEIMKEINARYQFNNDPLTRQEVLHGLMQLYNNFSTHDINKLNVKNGDIIKGLGVNDYCRQSILAGLELELIGIDDVRNANSLITPNQMLDLIYRIIG